MTETRLLLMQRYDSGEPVDIGWGEDNSIGELASLLGDTVGFADMPRFDTGKPDGTLRKSLDVSRLCALGRAPEICVRQDIAATYEWFLQYQHEQRR